MKDRTSEMQNPFGEESCEAEIAIFRERYRDFYFFEAPFNDDFLEPDRYLIIGRRGTGKTSLAQFLSFQNAIDHARYIYADQPELYAAALNKLADQPDQPNEIAIPQTRKIWEYLIWELLFNEYKQSDSSGTLAASALPTNRPTKPSNLIQKVADKLIKTFLRDDGLAPELEEFLTSEPLEQLKNETLKLVKQSPALLAIDSLEHYSTDNTPMMRSVAALISAASSLNSKHASDGIHVKVFLSGEVFPYLLENVVENPGKHVRSPLWLHWRPKDLIRLVCWRFYHYLIRDGVPELAKSKIDWNRFGSVKEAVWAPYFGTKITNRLGVEEESFAYVLRHTQMRPRQLVYLCNQIAIKARKTGAFPHFMAETIRDSIHASQSILAGEVLNAYASTFPKVEKIVNALTGLPKVFKGKELDRVAPRTASEWPPGKYSPSDFRELVAELGIVGRVRNYDEKSGFAEVNFEYSLDVRLALQSDDLCAIHPMFYQRLHIGNQVNAIVYPFPDHPEFEVVRRG